MSPACKAPVISKPVWSQVEINTCSAFIENDNSSESKCKSLQEKKMKSFVSLSSDKLNKINTIFQMKIGI